MDRKNATKIIKNDQQLTKFMIFKCLLKCLQHHTDEYNAQEQQTVNTLESYTILYILNNDDNTYR